MPTLKFDGWKLNIHFSAAHCIPYHHKCERLHGHHYAIHLEMDGDLDPTTGWVMDFTPVKKTLKQVADELDHRVIVPTAPGRVTTEVADDQVVMGIMDKRYVFPREDCALVDIPTSTAEHLAGWVLQRVLDQVQLPDNVTALRIGVDEGYGQGAWVAWTR